MYEIRLDGYLIAIEALTTAQIRSYEHAGFAITVKR